MSQLHNRKTYLPELISSGVLFVFFFVARFVYYELDHGLRNTWTDWAYVPALVLLIAVLSLFAFDKWRPHSLSIGLMLGATLSLSLYLFIQGVLEMASVSSPYIVIVLVLSILLYVSSFVSEFLLARNKEKDS